MKSVHLPNLDKRTPQFGRNTQLDVLLDELKLLLEPVDKEIQARFDHPQWPPLCLVGNPRSGTTLLMQLLATTDQFAVPSNLLSRFYYAPYLGAKIQQLLTNPAFDYMGELSNSSMTTKFESKLGKTEGVLSPNEFFHFWRRFIPNYDPEYISPEDEEKINGRGLVSSIAAIEGAVQKPFAAKAALVQYNLPKVYKLLSNCIIVYVRRDYKYVMQSIYEARKTFYDRLDIWWSVKPKEFLELQHLDAYQQIAGQVYFTDKALVNGLSQIPDHNQLIVNYEDICQQPKDFYNMLKNKYKTFGYTLPEDVALPDSFSPSNKIRIPETELEKLMAAYYAFEKLGSGGS